LLPSSHEDEEEDNETERDQDSEKTESGNNDDGTVAEKVLERSIIMFLALVGTVLDGDAVSA